MVEKNIAVGLAVAAYETEQPLARLGLGCPLLVLP